MLSGVSVGESGSSRDVAKSVTDCILNLTLNQLTH